MPLILASTSPRRRELLALLGIPFDVKSPSFEERLVAARPAIEQVQSFAEGKAQSVARQEPEAVVLGSDTVIEVDHDVLGKPDDLAEARAMLRHLAGRDHHVRTAVALVCSTRALNIVALSTATISMQSSPMPTGPAFQADCKGVVVSLQCRPIIIRCHVNGGNNEPAMSDISGARWWRRHLCDRGPVDGRRSATGLGDRCESIRGRGAEGLGSRAGADGEGQHTGGRQEGSSASLHGHARGSRPRERSLRSQCHPPDQALSTRSFWQAGSRGVQEAEDGCAHARGVHQESRGHAQYGD
ncbi:MAG: Maf-like protein [Nitrospirae bacterium]|nr:MAG: Maf-like protein [Nitrospirota bacterium]